MASQTTTETGVSPAKPASVPGKSASSSRNLASGTRSPAPSGRQHRGGKSPGAEQESPGTEATVQTDPMAATMADAVLEGPASPKSPPERRLESEPWWNSPTPSSSSRTSKALASPAAPLETSETPYPRARELTQQRRQLQEKQQEMKELQKQQQRFQMQKEQKMKQRRQELLELQKQQQQLFEQQKVKEALEAKAKIAQKPRQLPKPQVFTPRGHEKQAPTEQKVREAKQETLHNLTLGAGGAVMSVALPREARSPSPARKAVGTPPRSQRLAENRSASRSQTPQREDLAFKPHRSLPAPAPPAPSETAWVHESEVARAAIPKKAAVPVAPHRERMKPPNAFPGTPANPGDTSEWRHGLSSFLPRSVSPRPQGQRMRSPERQLHTHAAAALFRAPAPGLPFADAVSAIRAGGPFAEALFERLDTDKDGKLSRREFAKLISPPITRSISPRGRSPSRARGRDCEACGDEERTVAKHYMGFRNGEGEREGYGVMKAEDGTMYTGQWHCSRRHGHGTLFFNGGVFEGQWLRGNAHGEGIVHFKNGDVFRGAYSRNEKAGRGTYTWADGTTEVGQYLEGRKHGWHRWVQGDEAWDMLYANGTVAAARRAPHDGKRVSGRELVSEEVRPPPQPTPLSPPRDRSNSAFRSQGFTPEELATLERRSQIRTPSRSPAPAHRHTSGAKEAFPTMGRPRKAATPPRGRAQQTQGRSQSPGKAHLVQEVFEDAFLIPSAAELASKAPEDVAIPVPSMAILVPSKEALEPPTSPSPLE